MPDGIGNRRSHACHNDLAETFDTSVVDKAVWAVNELDFRATDVSVHGNDVFGDIGVQETAITRINFSASLNAAPMPQTTPPLIWLSAMRGLITRPQSAKLALLTIKARVNCLTKFLTIRFDVRCWASSPSDLFSHLSTIFFSSSEEEQSTLFEVR